MKQHVIKICQTAYYELRRFSSIHTYLTEDATKQLVTSCVLVQTRPLQFFVSWVLTALLFNRCRKSRILLHTFYYQSTTPSKLHTYPTATPLASNFWTLKIQTCLHVLQRNPRFRLLSSFWVTTPLESFPLFSALRQTHACFNHKTHGFRTFSHFGPHSWNNLPQDIRHSATLSSFKSKLKTFSSQNNYFS